ncbi:MAG: hypothetical protein JWN99_1741 [Ilumatobacteraceae bacterium]|nr:hypothetical protein [Ilumatobacteraceae bacterium]
MFRRPSELVVSLSLIAMLCAACGVGQRPTLEATPTVVGTMTGEPAIDQVLTRLDKVSSAVFTADYTAVLAYGTTASTVAVTQDGADPAALRRSVTIGDVRYINKPGDSSTCSVASAQCSAGIDPAKVSDTGVTPDFSFGDMAKRLRRDATARVGDAVASTRQIAGATATCVDLPVTGGTKQYCAFDDGVIARYVGGDLTLDADTYDQKVDELLFLV